MAKAHENHENRNRGCEELVEKLLILGQENPCKRRQKMPKQDEVLKDQQNCQLKTRGVRCEVVDYILMMMCRSSRLLHNRVSDQRMRQNLP